MKYIMAVYMCLLTAPLMAVESLSTSAVPVVETAPSGGGSTWENILQTIIVVVVIPLAAYGVKWLQAKTAKEQTEADKLRHEGKEFLREQVLATLYRIVSNIAEKELAELQASAVDGKIDKAELKKLGELAKKTAIEEFRTQGIDLISEFGGDMLDSAIRYIVDRLDKKKKKDDPKSD